MPRPALTETQKMILALLRTQHSRGYYKMHVDDISRGRGAKDPLKARLGTNSALQALERRGLVSRFPSRNDRWATHGWFPLPVIGEWPH